MILVLDNYDSFTYNLVQYIGETHSDIEVVRNDALTPEEIFEKKPSHIIVSPGPCTPNEAGISVELIRKSAELASPIPVLGVCLGHQSMGAAFGGDVIRAPYLMHGKTSDVNVVEAKSPLFKDIGETFTATRYHSLIVKKETLPSQLQITAESTDGIIMAMEHKEKPLYGLQFHPESILTDAGKKLISNFLSL